MHIATNDLSGVPLTLINRFNKLTLDEKHIMLMMAVAYKPIMQTLLYNTAQRCDFKQTGQPLVTGIVAKPLRERLSKLGLNVAGNQYQCPDIIVNRLVRCALSHGLYQPITQALKKTFPAEPPQNTYYSAPPLTRRILRELIFNNQPLPLFNRLGINTFDVHATHYSKTASDLFFNDFDATWFLSLAPSIQFYALAGEQVESLYGLSIQPPALIMLKAICEANSEQNSNRQPIDPAFFALLARQRLFQGRIEDTENLLLQASQAQTAKNLANPVLTKTGKVSKAKAQPNAVVVSLNACVCFLKGDNEQALELFEQALKLHKKTTRKRNVCLPSFEGLLHVLALTKTQQAENIHAADHLLMAMEKSENDSTYRQMVPVAVLLSYLQSGDKRSVYFQPNLSSQLFTEGMGAEPLKSLLLQLLWFWSDTNSSEAAESYLYTQAKRAQKTGHGWYLREARALLAARGVNVSELEDKTACPLDSTRPYLVDMIPVVAQWSRSLSLLQSIGTPAATEVATPAAPTRDSRLVWWFDKRSESLAPREQKLGKNGRWSKGRAVAMQRLHDDIDSFAYLTEQDKRICASIDLYDVYSGWNGYSNTKYELGRRSLMSASEHPLLFLEGTTTAIKFTEATPQLMVNKSEQLTLSLEPFPNIHREGPMIEIQSMGVNHWQVTEFDASHIKIAEVLSSDGLVVPLSAEQQVLDSIATIAPLLTIHSDIGGGDTRAENITADSRLHIHLQPEGQGLQLQYLCQPLGEHSPFFKPGVGGETLFAEVNGKPLQTQRDLKQEADNLRSLGENCPALEGVYNDETLLEDPQQALQALEYLQNRGDELILSWPKGQSMRLTKTLESKNMSLSVGGQQQDWFALEGTLDLGNGQVLELENLLKLVSHGDGRFVRLDEGQVLSLSVQLHKQLQTLAGLSSAQGLHPLVAVQFEEFTRDMALTQSEAWKKQGDKIAAAYALNVTPPNTLQAQLRDYQQEGFLWMSQLAHWGAGACLADDMGLGKTVQSLALILTRAEAGPTLVLAPTSVCINWLEEITRFAPSLNLHYFAEGDRTAMLDNAGPRDIIVCSYGLLQTSIEQLEQAQFATIVADEAQALKNPMAKRTQAAMRLKGDFKMITTGTPIENHLGELWSLFRFINPGLLGSHDEFNKRFAEPIEGQQDAQARQRLKTLIKPFMLRRLKSEVLSELPPRTEINLTISPSKEEAAFYEALRRQAVASLLESSEDNGGSQKLKVLAEIMRLRRACCNPELILPDASIPSAKLEAFTELVSELKENNHRALVFSQFVGHLELLRTRLDKLGIEYQYLDGSTPASKRKKAVQAFQGGAGDVFLISLKAGGAGLNLTAADYVIHMDPWWNPAVEDQASDRAHRMGQTRPVTIYRMVMENSIEEKILAMHHQKRDLATSLLEGNESAGGKLALDEMMVLLNNDPE
ncbi:MAG: DEAD/DEAH box helicase [Gammaproteobacteria bacterium]|nr:DEAD/DEAH box helicase [Gammaproteobacteria bacterium]